MPFKIKVFKNFAIFTDVIFSYFSETVLKKRRSYHFQNKISTKLITTSLYSAHVRYNIH